jgi:glycosyltransferase involved in cell wall biosynthesis
VARILFVYRQPATFIDIDRDLLAERWEVEEWHQRSPAVNVARLARAVRRSDLVFGWFAAWHTLAPVALARRLRRPSVLVIGGYDMASVPDIGYGLMRGGWRAGLTRWVVRHADRLVTNSSYSLEEIEGNAGIPRERVTVVHHGVPDELGALPDGAREPRAVTVGMVVRDNLERKGLRPFVEAAAHVPEAAFTVVGGFGDDGAGDELRAMAPANVEFTGFLGAAERDRVLAESSVYVQPSRHEGFGMSVAEAMLAGCVPVVTRAGALPEVVGDAGVVVDPGDPEALAAGIRRALASDEEARRRARQRVLDRFPIEVRRSGLHRVVEEALGERASA